MINRHQTLRTSFAIQAGENCRFQKIHRQLEFKIEYSEPAAGVKLNVTEFIRPFDLSQAPVVQDGLIRTGELSYIMLYDLHHMICDGLSMNILIKEFSQLYAGKNYQTTDPI